MKILKDILTEKSDQGRMYSQGRVYLLVSVLSYYLTIGFMTTKSLRPDMSIDVATLEIIIEALRWSMALFAGYAFGGKGIDLLRTVVKKNEKTNSQNGGGATPNVDDTPSGI